VEKKDFLSRAKDRNFAKTFGIEGATFEGYLYPDTYNFEKGVTPDEIITKMTQKFLSVYNAEIAPTAKTRKISMTGLVTLASIVEKETGAGAERDMVASVYRNRLKRRMRLQSDPTVIYGIEKFNGNLTRKDLATKTPYNTYTNYGLPPGPIANPGRASLLAALNPADTDYLYFVSMNNGTHRFSKTLKEHNAAVDEFQRSRRGRRR
ncbi:MAG: endolytic transglycosylase MltG, partial [Nitrospirota bacterium]|nr:endolytic transglycosylase MltG [Nitrospirota bacterium]